MLDLIRGRMLELYPYNYMALECPRGDGWVRLAGQDCLGMMPTTYRDIEAATLWPLLEACKTGDDMCDVMANIWRDYLDPDDQVDADVT